jgi:hypothetical protein
VYDENDLEYSIPLDYHFAVQLIWTNVDDHENKMFYWVIRVQNIQVVQESSQVFPHHQQKHSQEFVKWDANHLWEYQQLNILPHEFPMRDIYTKDFMKFFL